MLYGVLRSPFLDERLFCGEVCFPLLESYACALLFLFFSECAAFSFSISLRADYLASVNLVAAKCFPIGSFPCLPIDKEVDPPFFFLSLASIPVEYVASLFPALAL